MHPDIAAQRQDGGESQSFAAKERLQILTHVLYTLTCSA